MPPWVQARIVERISKATEVFLCAVVIGELYYGAVKSSQAEKNLQRIKEYASQNAILDVNAMTAWHYGNLKNELRKKGRPIPENDLWIAAMAMQHNLILISRDKHFHEIEYMFVEEW